MMYIQLLKIPEGQLKRKSTVSYREQILSRKMEFQISLNIIDLK